VTFADDSYVIVDGKNRDELLSKTKKVMEVHLKWLQEVGMVCNLDKTEIMIMNEPTQVPIQVGSRIVNTRSDMKVLGVQFDSKLDWTKQVSATVSKTNGMYFGLKTIRRHLKPEQAKQVVTAYYFSVLYYGIEIWFHRGLGFHLKRKIRSAHYRVLRLIFGKEKTRDELDATGCRATPDEWANYSTAKQLARMVNTGSPRRLLCNTLMNAFAEKRQPGRLQFYDDSLRKIGRQSYRNRLMCVARQMKFKWTITPITSLRTNLKKCFFAYYKVNPAN